MPVRKRGKAYEVTVCYQGSVVRRSSLKWSKAQAREIERKLLDDLIAAHAGKKLDRTFNDALERFMREDFPYMKSQKQLRGHLRALAPFMEGRLLKDAGDVAETAKQAWASLSPTTVNIRLRLLKSLVGRAHKDWEWLDQPPRIRLIPNNKERHKYLTKEQVHALAAACPISGGYVLLAAYTGIRRGHLLRLTAADITNGCFHLGTDSKTGEPQLVPIHPDVANIAESLPLPCSEQDLRREWDSARIQLGLRGFRFHDLRHTCASWLLEAGADLMHVREMLGHSTVSMTQRYAHLKSDALRKAVNKI